MILKYVQLLLLLSPFTVSSFGQSTDKLNPINHSDFSTEKLNYSKIIQQHLLVTFPFTQRPGKFGALDDQFKLEYETSVRLHICEESKDFYFIAGPYIEDSEINLQSIIKYTLEKQKIIQRKLKKDEIHIIVNDSTFILDFSGLINNPSTIIDLKYSITTNNKTQIIALLDNNKIYNTYSIRLEIPEIYSFDIPNIIDDLRLKSNSKKIGELIGYRTTDLPQPTLAIALKDLYIRNNPNSKVNFQPVNYKINISSYFLQRDIPPSSRERNEILYLRLVKINEIK